MARYVRSFIVESSGEVHLAFQEAILNARAAVRVNPANASTVRVLERAYREWMADLDRLAVITAADATNAIKRVLSETARRPDTGVRPHLRDAIVSRPFTVLKGVPTGSVGVADRGRLERVTNPFDARGVPYWIVQEEGTSRNVGRTLRGYFFDRGHTNPTRPAPGFTGTAAAQPLFLPGRVGGMPSSVGGGIGPRGGQGGKGVIRNPIPARHYVERGADDARARWRARVALNEARAMQQAAAAVSGLRRPARRP